MSIGILFLAIAWSLYTCTQELSLMMRGMARVFLGTGLFQVIAGLGYAYHATKRMHRAIMLYSKRDDPEIRRQEITRMHKVLKSGYTGGIIIYISIFLYGLIVMLSSSATVTKEGMAIALMVVGIVGLGIEYLSYTANRQYLREITSGS